MSDSASEGRNSVQAQTRNPAVMPASAPRRVAPCQNSPATIAGATWAAAQKETSPIDTRANVSPTWCMYRKPSSTTATMEARRTPSSRPVKSTRSRPGRRSSTGTSRSLHTMVLRATLSTTTMAVAADSPPMQASSASQGLPVASGRVSTAMSGSLPGGSSSSPAKAIGSTNRLMANR